MYKNDHTSKIKFRIEITSLVFIASPRYFIAVSLILLQDRINEISLWFIFNAFARYVSPVSPISLLPISNVVRVYEINIRQIDIEPKNYFVHFQSISKMLCSNVSNAVLAKFQIFKCLDISKSKSNIQPLQIKFQRLYCGFLMHELNVLRQYVQFYLMEG